MSSPPPPGPSIEPNVPTKLDPIAGLLSYLVPGLGQISQGRVGKGLLFFFSLYALFFYGMFLGKWSNVYLPSTLPVNQPVSVPSRLLEDLLSRPHFAGQFFIGIAAWPSIYQYRHFDEDKETGPLFGRFQRAPRGVELEEWNDRQRDENKRWDLGWVYTIIAGVLNILVIYDALAGPAFREVRKKPPTETEAKVETPQEPVTP